jgi:hypothetical protein
MEVTEGLWRLDEDDWALYAMLCDPVYHAELLWEDRQNPDYGGCYHVMDYQYPMFRYSPGEPYEIDACARSVGKTESAKAKGCSHAVRRDGDPLLITAPEMIHLDPLCQAIESRIRDTRLLREFLDTTQRSDRLHAQAVRVPLPGRDQADRPDPEDHRHGRQGPASEGSPG